MLVLRSMVRDGVLPLLGPASSVGGFHHGAAGYYLLAPSALLSGASPTAAIGEMVVLGLAAVAAAWWLGHVIGGRWAALVVGLLVAVSPPAVEASTFVWNPNPVGLFAALALGAAWRARQTGRARWWALAIGATAVVANLQVLGAILAPPVLALLAAELLGARRRQGSERTRAALRGLAAGLAVAAIVYAPFLISELQTGFAETRALAVYALGGGATAGTTLGFLPRLIVIALRVVGWPFVGLVTDVPVVASLAVAAVSGLLAWVALRGRGEAGVAGRWLLLSIAWSIVALTILAPSLASVVAVLPNDHYHAFVDPMILAGVALAIVEMGRRASSATRSLPAARAAVAGLVGVVALGVAIALVRQPLPDPNGGWPAARLAGAQVLATVRADAAASTSPGIAVVNLPEFEPPTWISYPIVAAADSAREPWPLTADPKAGDYLVLSCDRAFESQIRAACGGPADSAWLPTLVGSIASRLQLVERFDLSPRVNVSIYRVLGPPS